MSRLPMLVAAGLLLASPWGARATVVQPQSRARLAARSDTIVRARILGQAPARSAVSGRPLVVTRLRVLEVYKGAAPAGIAVEQLAGSPATAGLAVRGDAELALGEEAVLFLRCAGRERCRLYGLGMGKYVVRMGPAGKRLAVCEARGLADVRGSPLPLDALPLESLERELRGRR